MRCPVCGTEMNRHAEKPVKSPEFDETEVIAVVHTCPACGKVELEMKFPGPRE